MKIHVRVARVAEQRKASQALVICADGDLMPVNPDAAAVHALAGDGMKAACAALGQLALGAAVSTPAFNLPAQAVFHVHAPRDVGDSEGEDKLRQAMREVLRLAAECDVRSLAMPAMGAGRVRARNDVAAAILIKALLDDAPRLSGRLLHVTICLPSLALARGFDRAQQLYEPDDERPKTVGAAVQYLVNTLPKQTLAELSSMKEDELILTHFGLALYLRNGLLKNNIALADDTDSRDYDGASSVVVRALWRELKRLEKVAAH